MYNKTLLSLAVASSITLTGCIGTESGDNEGPGNNPNAAGLTWPIFNPAAGALPIPSDLNFRSDDEDTTEISEADGSFSVTDSAPPVTTALNQLSGASTVAPPVVRLNGQIDADTVDSRAFVLADPEQPPSATNIIPNPGQNVFLIELEYASGDPVLGLSAGEVPTASLGILLQKAQGGDTDAAAEVGAQYANPKYEAEVVSLDGTSAIRINPTKPLNPFKRYIVVVTNEVLDINGDPIVQSPTYKFLTNTDNDAPQALAPVATLINSFWEATAAGFFDGITNNARPTGLTVDDIALSYSFTTSNDERVLPYIVNPTAYLTDTIRGQARLAGVKAALAEGTTDYADLVTAGDNGEAAFVAESPAPDIETAAAGAASAISSNLPSGTVLPTPMDRGDTATFGASQDVVSVSAVASNFVEFGDVDVFQGTITTPYYLGVPTTRGGSDAEGAVINSESWKADAAIATAASGVLLEDQPALAQSDPMVSTVVNYRFALPDLVEEVDIPVLVLRPAGHGPGDPTVIYQHGITTDRSTALTFGSALAKASGAAVIAIDHPLHGVTPFSEADQLGLAISLVTEGALSDDQIATLAPLVAAENQAEVIEALEGFEDSEGNSIYDSTAAMTTGGTLIAAVPLILAEDNDGLATVIESGGTAAPAAAIEAGSLINTVANAGSTVPGLAKTEVERHFDYTANASNAPTAMTATSGASGSLFINLNNFTNSRDKNRQSILDLVNLRMSIGSIDLDGGGPDLNGSDVYFVGHSLGTIVGIPFVSVVNESASAADNIVAASMLTPGGGIVRLLENSPSFAPTILGGLQAAAGLEQGDANLELFLNVNQAALDSADPVNFVDNLIASQSSISLQQVNGDLVIPNSDDEMYEDDTPLVDNAFDAPLAGSEPLARLFGATEVNTANSPVAFDADNTASITRYLGGTHSTPVLPSGQLAERVFGEMVRETRSLIEDTGGQITQNSTPPAPADPAINQVVEQ